MAPQNPAAPPATAHQDGTLTLRELLRAVLTGWRWVFGTTVVVVALALVVTRTLPPIYESEVLLRMESPSSSQGLLGQLSPLSQLGIGGVTDEIDTQVGVLGSRRIRERVVDSLSMRVRVLEPRVARDSVLRVLRAPRDDFSGEFVLDRAADGSYDVRVEESDGPFPAPSRVRTGASFQLADVTLELLRPLHGPAPERIRVAVVPHYAAVDELESELEVQRRRGARLVEVTYRNRDRVLSSEVPNVVAATFIEFEERSSSGESLNKVRVLREQVGTYATQLRQAEDRLRSYRERAQIVEPKTQASEQIQRLSALKAQRDAQVIERESLTRLLAQVERSGPSDTLSSYRRLATFPSFVANRAVQDILQSLITAEDARAELLITQMRTPQNRDVRGMDARIDELEEQLHQFATSYLRSLENQIGSADVVLTASQDELATIPAREVEFIRLTRETELLNQVYGYLQTSLKEAEIGEATDLGTVRVVDAARRPREPVSPQPMLNLGLALFLGLTLGTTLAIGRRILDPRVRVAADAEAAAGMPVLEVIPLSGAPEATGITSRLAGRAGRDVTAELEDGSGLSSDAYQSLWLSLSGADARSFRGVVVLSSTSDNDGRSTTALNLSASLARQGIRTLLIDADLRQGAVHRALNTVGEPGLAQLLTGQATTEDTVQTLQLRGAPVPLHFLPNGGFAANAAELLASDAMRDLLARSRELYSVVIVDTPAINQARDGLALHPSADAVLLVAQAGSTDKESLQQASRKLRQMNFAAAGVVLNEPVARRSSYAKIRVPRLWGAATTRSG